MKRFKKLLFISILVLVCTVFTSCSSKKEVKAPIDKIHEKLTTMENYGCIAELTYVSNKGDNTYKTRQYYKMTGEYRIDLLGPETVKGLATIYDGEKVMQYNPRIMGEVVNEIPESKSRNEIFLGVFLRNYLQSEEVTLEVFEDNNKEYTVLEAVIPEGGKFLSTEKLWVSNETLNPMQLVIYDMEGKERVIVKYEEFKYNIKLDDALFEFDHSNEGN